VQPPPIPREQIADASAVLDNDGVQRRGLLYAITQEPAVPSLSWALAERYLKGKGAKIDGVERNGEFHLKVNDQVFWKFRNYSGAYVRADEGGYQILINWRKSNFETISVSEILDGSVNRDRFKSRIVIIGAYAPTLKDQFLTPLNSEWSGSPRRIYGIEAIAQVTSYILSAVLDNRQTMLTWREPWISFAIVSSGLITGYLFKRVKIERLNLSLFLVFWVSVSLLGLFNLLLSLGFWVPVLPIILVIYGTAIAQYFLRTTHKRIADFEAIQNLNQERQFYIKKLEDTIDKRQHYRILDDRLSSLGEEIDSPLQNIILINQKLESWEDVFLHYIHGLQISDVHKYKGRLLVAEFMLLVNKLTENQKFLKNKLSIAFPNLSHLDGNLNLAEVNPAFNLALEEVRQVYLGIDDFGIDIKPNIHFSDRRVKKAQYIQVFRLKILLAYLIDQPIRSLYLQQEELPQIEFILEDDNSLILFKVYISHFYEPSEYSLHYIQKNLEYNQGSLEFYRENNRLVWLIKFYAENR
jgi:adenylate cyclase